MVEQKNVIECDEYKKTREKIKKIKMNKEKTKRKKEKAIEWETIK